MGSLLLTAAPARRSLALRGMRVLARVREWRATGRTYPPIHGLGADTGDPAAAGGDGELEEEEDDADDDRY